MSMNPPRVVVVLTLALALGSCGSNDKADVANDPAGQTTTSSSAEPPTGIPAADGKVFTKYAATVMDTDSPELCLGAIAESYPPQCSGLPLEGWDWTATDIKDTFDQQGKIRWGTYFVTGTFDGTTFTVTDASSAALTDPIPPEPSKKPEPSKNLSDDELTTIVDGLANALPGFLTGGTGVHQVEAEVVYDDGSLQAWADQEYGANVVLIGSALVPVE